MYLDAIVAIAVRPRRLTRSAVMSTVAPDVRTVGCGGYDGRINVVQKRETLRGSLSAFNGVIIGCDINTCVEKYITTTGEGTSVLCSGDVVFTPRVGHDHHVRPLPLVADAILGSMHIFDVVLYFLSQKLAVGHDGVSLVRLCLQRLQLVVYVNHVCSAVWVILFLKVCIVTTH